MARNAASSTRALDWEALALRLWAAGVLGMLLLEWTRYRRLRRSLVRQRGAPPQLEREIERCARRLAMRAPETRVCSGLRGPFVCGVLAPALYWPASMLGGDARERRSVITHELAHLKRRDPLVAWIEIAAGALFWWNPLVGWVRRRLREAAECACDAWVVWAWPEDRRRYAEALLEVTEQQSRFLATPALGMSRGHRREFERRLTSILRDRAPVRLSGLSLAPAFALALCAAPGWSAVPAQRAASFIERETPPPAAEAFQHLFAQAAQRALATRPDAGLSVALVRGKELLWVESAGALGPDVVHPVGSITNALTASLCAQMRERGQLGFDDPVGRHLDGAGARGRELTLRHLLEHTAGLPREVTAAASDDPLLALLRASQGAAGVEYAYSRVGYALLGRTLATVASESFETLLARELFEPLGMASSAVGAGEPYPAADGVHSTARDLARFVALQLTAGSEPAPPLSAAGLRELQRPTRVSESWINPRSLAWDQTWTNSTESFQFRASKRAEHATYVAFSLHHRVGLVVLGRHVGGVERLGLNLMAEAIMGLSDTRHANTLFEQERYADALPELERLCALYPDCGPFWFRYGYTLLAEGRQRDALPAYEHAFALGASQPASAYNLACTHARLGELEPAFEWLERALELGFKNGALLASDSDLAPLRADPRFATLAVRDY